MKIVNVVMLGLLVALLVRDIATSVAEKKTKIIVVEGGEDATKEERQLQDMDYGPISNKASEQRKNGTENIDQGKKRLKISKRMLRGPSYNNQRNNAQWNNNQSQNQFGQNQNNGQRKGNRNQNGQFNPFGPAKPEECDLSVEVFPLYYTPVLRASTFRLAFSSSCMSKRDVNFEVYYKNENNINFNANPSIVNLELWATTTTSPTPSPRSSTLTM